MADTPTILVVDDDADALEILTARLENEGYSVETASDGVAALEKMHDKLPDLVLLDRQMPRLDGLAALKRIKSEFDRFVPTILVTAHGDVRDVVEGLDLGADEYIAKPFDHSALVARVRAMLRLKTLHDEIADLNTSLERRVAKQVDEIQRVSRLKRFLAPQVAEAILRSPDAETALKSHRRDVAVLFCDLRGFTAFAETAEPDDLMELLAAYHGVVGRVAFEHGGTLERFAGDGAMIIFNDPVPLENYRRRAVETAFDLVCGISQLVTNNGVVPGIGVGIAAGPATLGRIGFSERLDYAADRACHQSCVSTERTRSPLSSSCRRSDSRCGRPHRGGHLVGANPIKGV